MDVYEMSTFNNSLFASVERHYDTLFVGVHMLETSDSMAYSEHIPAAAHVAEG
jgi:hypothetical protein